MKGLRLCGGKLIGITVLSALGLIGNYYRVELFFNVDFLFGSVFAILAVRLFGFYGIPVAFISSLYTYVLWNHPYAIIIFTCEAAFIAYFMRKNSNVIMLDLLYWVFCGIPIVFITYRFMMHMTYSSVVLIMLKQSINGIFAALTASLLHNVYLQTVRTLGRADYTISYRNVVFKLIVFIVLIPMMVYVIMNVRANTSYAENEIRRDLNITTQATAAAINGFLRDNLSRIDYLAELIGNEKAVSNPDFYRNELKEILNSSRYYISFGIIDKNLISHIFVSLDGLDSVNTGQMDFRFIDIENPEWRKEGIYISNLHSSNRTMIEKHVIYIIKKVFNDNNELSGYVFGAMDFDKIKHIIAEMTRDSGIMVTLLDRQNRVMTSTDLKRKPEDVWVSRNNLGVLSDVGSGIKLFMPVPALNVSVMTRWRNSIYTKTIKLTGLIPFTIVADMPLRPFVEYMNENGKKALTIIFVSVVLSVISAYVLSKSVTRQISDLSRISKNLPEKIARGEDIDWPDSVIEETSDIKENFRHMSEELSERFSQLEKQNDDLAKLLNNIPLIIFLKDTNNNIIRANRLAGAKVGQVAEEIQNVPVCRYFPDGRYYEEDQEVIASKKPKINVLTRYKLRTGQEMIARTTRVPLLDKKGEVDSILVIIDDITDEVKATEEKQKLLDVLNQQSKMAEMGAMINVITHQWKQPLNVISLVAQSMRDDIADGTVQLEDAGSDLDVIVENTMFLAQTISDFTDFFKKSKGVTRFNVHSVIRELLHLIDKQIIREGIRVVYDNEDSFEINSLKNEFKQVMLNLFSNAKDALASSKQNDRQIRISYEKGDKEGKIIFADNGGGIPEELLPGRIFEPYFTTKGDKGSGIGLFVSKSIITENMGGSIAAYNRDGGAVFEITIPYEV